MLSGGACALSILTDPESFQGGLNVLSEVAEQVNVPVIMKDIIVSPRQLKAGAGGGADVVVLISELFSRGLTDTGLDETVEEARRLGLEVLVEANGALEFEKMRSHSPDLYGINNRNLLTFQVDLDTTERILSKTKRLDRPVVSESGIESAGDIRRLKSAGAQAFLVGTSIMKSANVESKVRELVNA
jgi:indole-3-glycerol phosphate synthase